MATIISQVIESAPKGTSGLVVEPWAECEFYGVACVDWAQPACYIWGYKPGGWVLTEQQSADFGGDPRVALMSEIKSTSGEEDDVLVSACLEEAIEF